MFEEKDETILARWLAGKLTDEEREAFQKDEAFQDYQQIVQGLERFKKPEIDKEALREKLAEALEGQKKAKVIGLRPFMYIAGIAASIVLIVGLFFNEITYSAPKGEQLAIELPDGSKIQLNAASKLSRSRFFWKNDKVVTLKGEAFFDIVKGEGFKIETSSGTVAVLGTEFNIRIRENSFELACYEGKVQFETVASREKAILVEGDAISLQDHKIQRRKIQTKAPSWMEGTSVFSNQEFIAVVSELERQYNIVVENKEILEQARFTGSFVHDDLELALRTVFAPMGIRYDLSQDQQRVTVKLP